MLWSSFMANPPCRVLLAPSRRRFSMMHNDNMQLFYSPNGTTLVDRRLAAAGFCTRDSRRYQGDPKVIQETVESLKNHTFRGGVFFP